MMKDTITAEEAWKMCIDEVLVDEARIEGRLDEIADEIAAKYRGCLRPLVVVPILIGAGVLLAAVSSNVAISRYLRV